MRLTILTANPAGRFQCGDWRIVGARVVVFTFISHATHFWSI